jgi:hypothetical protein
MDYYTKLFDLSWIEPWLIEALIAVSLGLILAMILSRLAMWINGEDR